MIKPEKAAWELKNEKNKAGVRWLLVVLIGGYLGSLLQNGGVLPGADRLFSWYYIGAVTAFVAILNLAVTLYILRAKDQGTFHPAVKYLTMVTDLVAVSLVLLPTGGSESMFFLVYFVIIVSNALRYGMRLAVLGVLVFNILYVLVLAYQYAPNFEIPGFQKEVLKVSGVWLIGLYTGYLARRFEMLQGEVEKYQKLLASLMAEKKQ